MPFISYNPSRKTVWTEHSGFPKGAIKWRDDMRKGTYRRYERLDIYYLNPQRTKSWLIPEALWNLYQEGELSEQEMAQTAENQHQT